MYNATKELKCRYNPRIAGLPALSNPTTGKQGLVGTLGTAFDNQRMRPCHLAAEPNHLGTRARGHLLS